LSYQFGGGPGNNDETGQKIGGGAVQSLNAGGDDDTDPCSSGSDENEFEWSQSQRQSQRVEVGIGGEEDSQESMASAGSLHSAAGGSTGAGVSACSGGGGGQSLESATATATAKRRERNAVKTDNGRPPIPSFSPVEWSASHAGSDNDKNINEDKGDAKGGKRRETENENADKSLTKSKAKAKQTATKSIKRVGVGLDSPSSSSDEDKDNGIGSSGVKSTDRTSRKDGNTKKSGTLVNSSPDISSIGRAASAAAGGHLALAKPASKSAAKSAPSDNFSSPKVPSGPKPKASASKITSNAADATSTCVINATAGDPKTVSEGTVTRVWECSACTLKNPSWKRKCDACGSARPSSDLQPEELAADIAVANTDSVDGAAAESGWSKSPDGGWKVCGKPEPLEAPTVAGAKSPVIDLSLHDGGEEDKTMDDGQQKQGQKKVEATNSKRNPAREKPAVAEKVQSGEEIGPKKSKADSSKKAKTTKASKTVGAAGTTCTAGSKKVRVAQKKRKRKQSKKKAEAEASPNGDDDAFDIPASKIISDKEKTLDRRHADLLRQLAKKPSPGKDGGEDFDYENLTKRTKRGGAACALCSTCSCSRGSALKGLEEGAKLEAKNPISKLARSDAEIERALLGRLARLEKSASWFDTLCYKVGRELKKHRNKVSKRASLGGAGTNEEESKPRFLADADVDGQDNGVFYPRAKKSRVEKAHRGLFGTRPAVKEAQPTLTQMMRGEDGDHESDESDDTHGKYAPNDEVKGMDLKPLAEEEVEEVAVVQNNDPLRDVNDEDFHAAENGGVNESIIYQESEEGSPVEVRSPMADYREACQRGQERASRNSQVGMWNAASFAALPNGTIELPESPEKEATSLSNAEGLKDAFNRNLDTAINDESETGIHALLELFQEDSSPPNTPSPEKSKPSPDMLSQLSQRGRDAVEQLQDAILADPERLQAIETACPHWRGSIRYPFLHTKADNLEDALTKVRDSRRKLQDTRERILAALQQREEVHNLFETALLQSLNRFAFATDIPGSPYRSGEEKKSER